MGDLEAEARELKRRVASLESDQFICEGCLIVRDDEEKCAVHSEREPVCYLCCTCWHREEGENE